MSVSVKAFYHSDSSTGSYIAHNEEGDAVIIDSCLDMDMSAGKISFEFMNKQLAFLQKHDLTLRFILETHAHADHMSAAEYLKKETGALTIIGAGILKVQSRFNQQFNHVQLGSGEYAGFDRLVTDGEIIEYGSLRIKALHTPGHTDDSMSFVIDDNVFVGDTLFMPDGGTARCDFPGGSAEMLWDSIQKIHALADDTKIWVCHDYQPNGRELKLSTTVKQSKLNNIHVGDKHDKNSFVSMRNERDATLAVPKLLYPSLQINLWGGNLPKTEENGRMYIKVPLSIDSE